MTFGRFLTHSKKLAKPQQVNDWVPHPMLNDGQEVGLDFLNVKVSTSNLFMEFTHIPHNITIVVYGILNWFM